MTDRTGLGVVELAVLEGLDHMEARADRPHRKSAMAARNVYEASGVGPSFGYDAMCKLAAPWLMNIPLIDLHGNGGSLDFAAAESRYTEVRLTNAGEMALASERGELPRLPIVLMNGDLHIGGSSPPFDPAAIANAVQRAGSANSVSDDELIALVGLPRFPTGCDVVGDIGALYAGDDALVELRGYARIDPESSAPQIVVTNLPYGIGPSAAVQAITDRVNSYARMQGDVDDHRSSAGDARLVAGEPRELRDRMELSLRDLRDESSQTDARLVCVLRGDADPELCRDRILETWPVTLRWRMQLRAPLASLIRAAVDPDTAQAQALAALVQG